jgi:hypothetical protein
LRKAIVSVLLLLLSLILVAENVKTVLVPENVRVKTDYCKETLVKNLADVEIYESIAIDAFNNTLFILNLKPPEMIRLDLKGNVLLRGGKRGDGPGEFTFPISLEIYKGEIYVFDLVQKKLILFDKNLEYIREIRLLTIASDFITLPNGQFVFPQRGGTVHQKCLGVYSAEGKLLRVFGDKEIPFDPKDRDSFSTSDKIRNLVNDQQENRIWVSFRNRYDLSCFQGETKILSIREREDFYQFYYKKDEETKRKGLVASGGPIKLELIGDKLYNFYKNHNECFCDIFDKTNGMLLNRVQLDRIYFKVAHVKENLFFALAWNTTNEEDPYLYRIQFRP